MAWLIRGWRGYEDNATDSGLTAELAKSQGATVTPLYTFAPTIPAGWQQATHANAPKYGELVIVLTTDADGDPIPEFAHYNGELGFLGIGGKRIKPVSYWMPSPTAPKGEQP